MAELDFLAAIPRLTGYVALFLLVGAAAVGARLGRVGTRAEVTATIQGRALTLALIAAAVLTFTSLGSLYTQTLSFFGEDEGVNADTLRIIAFETNWGAGWRVQFGAATFALIGALLARRNPGLGWPVLAVGALIAAGAQALTGHAVESTWMSPTVVAQSLHVAAAALWIGSLMAIANVVIRGTDDAKATAAVIDRFSPLAIVSVAVLAVAGAFSAYQYLSSIADLWTTTYGRVLLAKLAAFALAARLGRRNWQHVKPRLPDAAAFDELGRNVTAELVLALVVLALTAVLVALPLPAWGI